ncbi:MAG: HEAT repeat domain-containing protein [Kofleriaceae bacterium]|jgi:hypothetical protein|nr:HEAT repeat domain-containing protein [Kofleriaceae bacterium]MBP6839654.1 HEAT repeat domain-containing protein [Kofleriaceae bacterium]MBP9203786.1 HEAT repeat domain-containing protein [Kofleriaceae bacterium]
MSRLRTLGRAAAAGALRTSLFGALLGTALTLAGCPDNPYEADTWIKKLDERGESERAVTTLEQLGDPRAIPALGKAWEKQGKPVRIIQVVIDLARPVTEAEASCDMDKGGKCLTNYPKGRPASWEKALPILQLAVTEIDENNPRSLDSAVKAADALGDAQLPEAMQALIAATANPDLNRPKAQRVRLSAIIALGKYRDPAAVGALTTMLKASLEDYGTAFLDLQKAKNEDEKKGANERGRDATATAAAAVNAMADLGAPEAVLTLTETMYRIPALASQVRRALVASGPNVSAELRKVLRGEHAAINTLFKDKKLDKYCGDKGTLPPDQCPSVSARDFYAALILGDLYDPASVPDLLKVLGQPALPVYYSDDAPSPNTQYNAVFDSLRKIGSAEGAAQVKALWVDPKAEAQLRALAVGAYGFIARDSSAVKELGAIAEENGADSGLRLEAATTYARLADSVDAIALLQRQAQTYAEASDKKKAEVAKAKPAYDKVKAEFDAVKKRFDDAKAKALKAASDTKLSTDQITAAAKEVDVIKVEFDAMKAKYKAEGDKFKPIERAVEDYRGYQRGFQTHIARIEIAIRCKGKPECFAGAFTAKPDEVAAKVAPHIKDIKDWTADEKIGLVTSQIERAALELGKMGTKASGQLGALLTAAQSDDRVIRQSVLLALPKVAPKPCNDCLGKLDEAIKAGQGKSTLAELNVETTILRNYFRAQGAKSDSAAPPAEAPAK